MPPSNQGLPPAPLGHYKANRHEFVDVVGAHGGGDAERVGKLPHGKPAFMKKEQ
jgi:hypothetical protein